jgi:protein-glucosylgalactosylhydroxylysine glucosidase
MFLSRRDLLIALPAALAAQSVRDRRSLVQRHNPVLSAFDPRSPLSIGNGEFAFTADVTGLQSFPERYAKGCPLCTQSHWGWHTFPNPGGFSLDKFRMTAGGYPVESKGQLAAYNWLRENPHRLNLARIGLRLPAGEPVNIRQTLDLWTGVLSSHFEIAGTPVDVETCVHPEFDLLAVTIASPLIDKGALAIAFAFPYGSINMDASDWSNPDRHRTTPDRQSARAYSFLRELDADHYSMTLNWEGEAQLTPGADHEFILTAKGSRIAFTAQFALESVRTSVSVRQSFDAAREHRARFWNSGIALGSENPELERRVVLSQYLTAIQSGGSLPPQETGLTCNSWYGKFHLEMYWWHTAHFALWGRPELLERSFGYYERILPAARATAKRQGFSGARWPKMVGPDGRESPSNVGPWLIWQQPHPIAIAELLYQAKPARSTLERYAAVVFESAEFMASYARFDEANARYVLGPPVIPAQENHPPNETWNPTFELEYWADALRIAQEWRRRLKLNEADKWERVRAQLSPLPVEGGVYLAHENCPQTFTQRNRDHPSMLMALGYLPGTKADPQIMRRTYQKVLETWEFSDTWGWDYGMMAMTAARLGERQPAIDALLMDTSKNRWLPNGHTWQRDNLPVYLPSNGALLSAVAMMRAWKIEL